jgi:glutaminase
MIDKANIQSTLNQIAEDSRKLIGQGHVADYIPALANVDPNQFAIAICDLEGNQYCVGDYQQAFSIQSISKLFNLIQAIQLYGDELWESVGREPSGQRFNSLVQLETEHGRPRNPFINAGAILVCDRLESRCSSPNYQLTQMLRDLSNNDNIRVDQKVAISELEHGSRNAAMAYLMQAFDNIENSVDSVLQSYSHHCAIEMNCLDLATATIALANQGKTLAGKRILSSKQTRRINALLATCGLYDEAGDFAFKVGLPGKSGVGGGIVAIYPGQYTISVWSPELNQAGNSLAGSYALEQLNKALNFSIY